MPFAAGDGVGALPAVSAAVAGAFADLQLPAVVVSWKGNARSDPNAAVVGAQPGEEPRRLKACAQVGGKGSL